MSIKQNKIHVITIKRCVEIFVFLVRLSTSHKDTTLDKCRLLCAIKFWIVFFMQICIFFTYSCFCVFTENLFYSSLHALEVHCKHKSHFYDTYLELPNSAHLYQLAYNVVYVETAYYMKWKTDLQQIEHLYSSIFWVLMTGDFFQSMRIL